MSNIVSEGERFTRILIPSGTFQAVCFDNWDIGHQPVVWQGQTKYMPKTIIGWELSEIHEAGELTGKRMTIFKKYTKSLAETARLRKDLESWRGKVFTPEELKGFDLDKLIGINCMLSIVHNESEGKTYANIASVSGLMKGLTPLQPENQHATPNWISRLQEAAKKYQPTENVAEVPVNDE